MPLGRRNPRPTRSVTEVQGSARKELSARRLSAVYSREYHSWHWGGEGTRWNSTSNPLQENDAGPVLFSVQQIHTSCNQLRLELTFSAGSSGEGLNAVILVSPDPPSSDVTVSPNVK